MKRTFVMAVAILFSVAAMAQTGTRRASKTKMQGDSMQNMSKDSLYKNLGSDTTSTTSYGKNRPGKKTKMNKTNKTKQRSKTTTDSATNSY